MKPNVKLMGLIGIFLIVAIAAMVLGFHLSGVDVLAWFSSKWAFIVYFFLGAYALLFVGVLVTSYVKGD